MCGKDLQACQQVVGFIRERGRGSFVVLEDDVHLFDRKCDDDARRYARAMRS